MRILMLVATLVAACMCRPAFAATSGVVYIEYYRSSGCASCDIVTQLVADVAARYAPMTTVLHHRLSTVEDWRPLIERAQVFGDDLDGPPMIYIGTNALYGVKAVLAGFEQLVSNGIVNGGAMPWQPSTNMRPRIVPRPTGEWAAAVQETSAVHAAPARPLRATVRAGLVIGLVLLVVVLAVLHMLRPRS